MILWQDLVNGSYELFAGALVWLNIRQIYRDKRVLGIHIVPTAAFASWGFWNLYYYPFLNQWLSFTGGVVMVTMNTIWISMAIYYERLAKTTK